MKKRYHLLTVLALSLGLVTNSFGQLQHQHNKPVNGSVSHHRGQTHYFNSSPNLHHRGDGQPCIADHLTEDWITNAGIEDQYRAEEQEQALMAKDYENSDRATYTVPIIFHVVYNT